MNHELLTERRLLRILHTAGIVVDHQDISEVACCQLTERGYSIHLGPLYFEAPDEHRAVVLLHELAHITRGDCLPVEGRDPALWNIAADTVINQVLPPQPVAALGGLRYEDLLERYKELPDTYVPSASVVYDALLKNAPAQLHSFDTLAPPEDGQDGDAPRRAHVRAVLGLRAAAEAEAGGEALLQRLGGVNIVVAPRRTRPIAPRPLPAASAALKTLRLALRRTWAPGSCGQSGLRERRRTWMRPGRVPGLRGLSRQRRAKVMLAVDVSVSMTLALEAALGVAHWLAREHQVEVWVFADRTARLGVGSQAASRLAAGTHLDVGGGTQYGPIMRAAVQTRPSVLVMVTDGYPGDRYTLPDCPVVWCLTERHATPALRGIDRAVMLDR